MLHGVAAHSEHPLATHATGECLGRLLESGAALGAGERSPAALVLYVTPAFAGALDDITSAAVRLLSPGATIGAVVSAVFTGRRETLSGAAVAMLGLWSDGADDPVAAVRLAPLGDPLASVPAEPGCLAALLDPFSMPTTELVSAAGAVADTFGVVGASLDVASRRGGNLLLAGTDGDVRTYSDGGVGLWVHGASGPRTVLAAGDPPLAPSTESSIDDAAAMDAELEHRFASAGASTGGVSAVLAFADSSRLGTRALRPDRDADSIAEAIDDAATLGAFGADPFASRPGVDGSGPWTPRVSPHGVTGLVLPRPG